ncbi:MAG: hypothetical protein ACLTGJ_03265 [Faecalibacterium prausnitzii]
MLQLISATGQQTVDALAFLLAFALTALMDSVFHDKLPHDHGRAFAVNGELSRARPGVPDSSSCSASRW